MDILPYRLRRQKLYQAAEDPYEEEEEHTLVIKKRDFWGAKPEKWKLLVHLPVQCVFIAYTQSDKCYLPQHCAKEMKYLQNYYTRNGKCPDIRYNFLVGGDGTVYEGRGWYTQPGLPPQYRMFNKRSLFIGLIGTFYDERPLDFMFFGLENLIKYGVQNKFIRKRFLEFSTTPAGIN